MEYVTLVLGDIARITLLSIRKDMNRNTMPLSTNGPTCEELSVDG